MADWSELPKDLVFAIAKSLDNHFDLLHFRSVCPTWRAAVPLNLKPRPTFYSLIHQGIEKKTWIEKKARKKYFIYKYTVCLLKFPPEHGQTAPRFWFVRLQEVDSGKTRLIHPLSWRKLKPGQYPKELDTSNFHVQEVSRLYYQVIYDGQQYINIGPVACMNVSPDNGDDDHHHFIMLGKYDDNGCLTFHKSRDEESIKIKVEGFYYTRDCIQYKRKFYAVDFRGKSVCIDPCSRVASPLETASKRNYVDKLFVELCGNLLLVELEMICEATSSFKFEVFQLDEERKRWNPLESLGDGILFLGGYFRFSAPAIPAVEGNCIVFNLSTCFSKGQHGNKLEVDDTFVFSLKSGRTLPLRWRPDLLQLFHPPFHS